MYNILSILLLLAILAVIVLSVLLVRCSRDGYCNTCGKCRGMGTKVCPNRPLLNKLYNEGKLTENSNLVRESGWTQPDHLVGLTTDCCKEDQ